MSTSPLDAILPGAFPLPLVAFGPASRYRGLPLATGSFNGIEVRYVTRRFLPDSERFASVEEHDAVAGQRADHLAYLAFLDPEMSWLLGDANNVMNLRELEQVGRRIRFTLPEGVPGPQGGL